MLGRRVVCPIDPTTQHIVLKTVRFLDRSAFFQYQMNLLVSDFTSHLQIA